MSVDVLLGRDSWLRFSTDTYTTDSPVSSRPLTGRLKLGHFDADSGAQAYVDDPTQPGDAFRLYYVGEHVVSLSGTSTNTCEFSETERISSSHWTVLGRFNESQSIPR